MFDKIYAVCLLVENYKKSLSFYNDILEFKINSQDKNYTDFKVGDTLFAIFEKKEAEVMFPGRHMNKGGGAVIAFPVGNVDEICKLLNGKGVRIFEGPKVMPWGQKVAYFKDPDNNIIEVTED